jgi:predicted ThiF/HesA family dinucleotide-utilizing enzyme
MKTREDFSVLRTILACCERFLACRVSVCLLTVHRHGSQRTDLHRKQKIQIWSIID